MQLSCAICADSISPSDDVNVTQCGHMFHISCLQKWLDRSSTCPQCRNRCVSTALIRLYLNQSLNETVTSDPSDMQNTIDNLKLKMRENDAKITGLETKLSKTQDTQKLARKTIVGLEQQLHTKELLLQNIKHDMDALKLHNKRIPVLERRLKEAKETLATLENVQNVVNSTQKEVEQMLKTEQSVASLCTLIVTMKREQRSNETKRNDLRNTLKVSQMECNKANNTKRELLEKISILESDLHKLQADVASSKCSELQKVNEDHYRTLITAKKQTNLKTECNSVEDASSARSPYLKIKSSSIGLAPLLKSSKNRLLKQQSVPLNIGENGLEQSGGQFSIFKKPRLGENMTSALRSTSNLVYNGIGGTERREICKFAEQTLSNHR